MIQIIGKEKCCGCGACVQICPKNAITMRADNEGFLYPVIDDKKCIKCGLCLKICPILNNQKQDFRPKVYVAKNKNTEVLKKSSSGGMFSILADYVLEQNGVVFGAAFNKNWEVYHRFIDKKEDLNILRRSKYVQSNTLETFKETKKFLEEDRQVLYTGTPCQIAGLKSFLNKEYDNLLTADIICHSVPSPGVWKEFLKQNYDVNKLVKIDFRDKKYGWDKSKLYFYFNDGKIEPQSKKMSLFRIGFGETIFCRPSCHKCYFKDSNRFSDFTIGDAWGYSYYAPEMFDRNGLSILFINTEKSEKLFNILKDDIVYKEVSFDTVIKYNPYYKTSVKPHIKREEFFGCWQKEQINKLIKELTYRPLWVRIYCKVKSMCKKILKI
ncbi:MAG: Coenzyme F420 hydrogenase/dehydrogenase, beta subunit C-terminal domain [Elusimicrobiaceae bacterium]|nr:Coenzyme F420 hydrogenase/dehydrogenase, beta subunit C-terminal domain [Elusimicrobiaceae bacterium]